MVAKHWITNMFTREELEQIIKRMLPSEEIIITPKESSYFDVNFEVVNIHPGQELVENKGLTFSATGRCSKHVEGGYISRSLFIASASVKVVDGRTEILKPIFASFT